MPEDHQLDEQNSNSPQPILGQVTSSAQKISRHQASNDASI